MEGEEEQINPGIWGRRLADYLIEGLKAAGFEPEEPIAEDWGYIVGIKNDEFSLTVSCAHQDGDPDEFVCLIHPDCAVIRKLFKKIDTTEVVGRLSDALDKMLTSDPGIHDVTWE